MVPLQWRTFRDQSDGKPTYEKNMVATRLKKTEKGSLKCVFRRPIFSSGLQQSDDDSKKACTFVTHECI